MFSAFFILGLYNFFKWFIFLNFIERPENRILEPLTIQNDSSLVYSAVESNFPKTTPQFPQS